MNFIEGKLVFDDEDHRRWTDEEISKFLEFYNDNSIFDSLSNEQQEKLTLFIQYLQIVYDGFPKPIKQSVSICDGDVFINVVHIYRELTSKVIANLITNYLEDDKTFESKFTDNIIDYPDSFGAYIIDRLDGEEELAELMSALSVSWSAGKEYGDLLDRMTGVNNFYHHISHKNLSIKYDFVFSDGKEHDINDFYTITNFLISIRNALILLASSLKIVNNMGDYIDLISMPASRVKVPNLVTASYSLIPIEVRNISCEVFMRLSMELSHIVNTMLDVFFNIYGINDIVSFHLEEIEEEINAVNAKGFNFHMQEK